MAWANAPDRPSYQKVLRSRMRNALMRGDHRGCWGQFLFSEVCHTATTFNSHEDAVLARLISFRNGYYVFIEHGSHYQTGQRSIFHARRDEFRIDWLGQGPNANGALLTGEELEDTLWSE
jgi:hypothetical protein